MPDSQNPRNSESGHDGHDRREGQDGRTNRDGRPGRDTAAPSGTRDARSARRSARAAGSARPGSRKTTPATAGKSDAERLRRRASFLRERDEAIELRERVKPRQARSVRMRQAMRMRTFRW